MRNLVFRLQRFNALAFRLNLSLGFTHHLILNI